MHCLRVTLHWDDLTTQAHECAVAHTEEDRVLEVTGFVCSDTSCSFYGVDGEISGAAMPSVGSVRPARSAWRAAQRPN